MGCRQVFLCFVITHGNEECQAEQRFVAGFSVCWASSEEEGQTALVLHLSVISFCVLRSFFRSMTGHLVAQFAEIFFVH